MFFGLSDFLKKILPKRLFYRALLIVAVPVLVLQLIITFVFFDSLWIKTNKGMTRALINEISTFVKVYDNEEIIKDELKNTLSEHSKNIKDKATKIKLADGSEQEVTVPMTVRFFWPNASI